MGTMSQHSLNFWRVSKCDKSKTSGSVARTYEWEDYIRAGKRVGVFRPNFGPNQWENGFRCFGDFLGIDKRKRKHRRMWQILGSCYTFRSYKCYNPHFPSWTEKKSARFPFFHLTNFKEGPNSMFNKSSTCFRSLRVCLQGKCPTLCSKKLCMNFQILFLNLKQKKIRWMVPIWLS